MSVYEKLNQVQSELNAPKGQYNTFGKYKYRSNEDILGALKPILSSVGASVVQCDSIKMIGDRYYVEATAQFIDCETGEMIENTSFAREPITKKGMDESQITGACSSYARKYALNGLFLIDDSQDADGMDNTSMPEQSKEPEKQWLNDISQLLTFATQNGWDGERAVKEARNNYKVSNETAEKIKKGVAQ